MTRCDPWHHVCGAGIKKYGIPGVPAHPDEAWMVVASALTLPCITAGYLSGFTLLKVR